MPSPVTLQQRETQLERDKEALRKKVRGFLKLPAGNSYDDVITNLHNKICGFLQLNHASDATTEVLPLLNAPIPQNATYTSDDRTQLKLYQEYYAEQQRLSQEQTAITTLKTSTEKAQKDFQELGKIINTLKSAMAYSNHLPLITQNNNIIGSAEFAILAKPLDAAKKFTLQTLKIVLKRSRSAFGETSTNTVAFQQLNNRIIALQHSSFYIDIQNKINQIENKYQNLNPENISQNKLALIAQIEDALQTIRTTDQFNEFFSKKAEISKLAKPLQEINILLYSETKKLDSITKIRIAKELNPENQTKILITSTTGASDILLPYFNEKLAEIKPAFEDSHYKKFVIIVNILEDNIEANSKRFAKDATIVEFAKPLSLFINGNPNKNFRGIRYEAYHGLTKQEGLLKILLTVNTELNHIKERSPLQIEFQKIIISTIDSIDLALRQAYLFKVYTNLQQQLQKHSTTLCFSTAFQNINLVLNRITDNKINAQAENLLFDTLQTNLKALPPKRRCPFLRFFHHRTPQDNLRDLLEDTLNKLPINTMQPAVSRCPSPPGTPLPPLKKLDFN